MKSIFFTLAMLFIFCCADSQNVGIGTTSPLARLHVTDSNVIFTAPVVLTDPVSANVPISGAGARFMWLPQLSAFRVGTATGTSWNAAKIGLWSFATGVNTGATGKASAAFGFATTASGLGSMAIGGNTDASGISSLATGDQTNAYSYASVAMGRYNDIIPGSNDTAWVATDPLLYIGNGDNPDFTHNAAVIYKNGDADINGYVRLGEVSDGSPRIKVKKLTATMPAAQGSFTLVPHGITQTKILNISSLVTVAGRYQIIPNHTQAGFQYTLNVDGANIALGAVAGNSSSVLGMPVKILITYEE